MDFREYQKEYNRQKYARVTIVIPKEKKEVLQAAATERGLSLSAAIVAAVEWYYNIDISSKEQNQ